MLIGAAGGWLFSLAQFPAGWMAGSLVFIAVAALAGRPMHVPSNWARLFFIVLGIVVGGVATPETVKGMSTWPASIAMISVAMIAVTLAGALYLHKIHRWELQTAMFAAVPGALSQVSAMAAERQSDLRAIIIVQTIRVVILAVGVPGALLLLGISAPSRFPGGTASIGSEPWTFATLIVASIVAAFGLYRLKFSGAFFFGPMLISATLHGSGILHASPPAAIASVSMIGLGAINGARFAGTSMRTLLKYTAAALGSLAVVVVVAGIFIIGASALLSLHVANLVVSYAPGSVDVMMILALAMHLDPVFVGAHHLARILVVSISLPFAARATDVRPLHAHGLPEPLEEARETMED
jgi:membrane AbrB-like protein